MRINVKNSEGVLLPVRATSKSAAYDVVAISEPEIVGEQYPDGGWKRIDYIQYDTGLITAPQDDNYGRSYHILAHPRSSVSKYNLLLANSIGLIDNDYRKTILVRYKYVWQPEDFRIAKQDSPSGEYFVVKGFYNESKIYKKGDVVAQLLSEPTTDADWVYVEDVDVTERTGGFGSTTPQDPMKEYNISAITESKVEIPPSYIPITNRVVGIQPKKVEPVKNYESKTDVIEQWKKMGGSTVSPTNYETLIREREKNLNP